MNNKIKYLPIGILTLTTSVSAVALSSSNIMAADTASTGASVTVSSVCSFTAVVGGSVNLSTAAGTTVNTEATADKHVNIGCNHKDGFIVKAVGFSPDATHPDGLVGNTALYNSASGATIPTGVSGNSSYWSFKVSSASATVTPAYATYASIPNTSITIATFPTVAMGTSSGTFRTDYQVHVGGAQASGAYKGAVKYTVSSS
ncbi:hypothetical protein IKG24_01255 [Candidatus Saccharibacteria bacterium]|nr:hypothetical protein [Candidatus Saccharibacteria bacterium]